MMNKQKQGCREKARATEQAENGEETVSPYRGEIDRAKPPGNPALV